MRILISYLLKDNTTENIGGCHNFPNIEKAWDWFDSKRKDCVLFNGALVKASYTNAKVHSLEQLYQSAVCNMGMGSVVAQTMIKGQDGRQHTADVLVSAVQ